MSAKKHTTNGTVRAAAYYRMSTPKQEDSIERQQSQVRPYAGKSDQNGTPHYVLVQEYADLAIAGDVFERRPDFQRLLKDAKAGLFSVIVVDEWSRLSRQEPVDFIANVVKPLRDAGVTLDTVAEGPQRWDSLAELILLTVRSDKSSEEVKRISKRVLSGMALFANEGRILSGAPYGYLTEYITVEEPGKPPKVVPSRYVPDPATAHIVSWIFENYASGNWTLDALCVALNERKAPPPSRKGGRKPKGGKQAPRWTKNAVRTILRNPKYTGAMTWNRRGRGKYHSLEQDGQVKTKDRPSDAPNPKGAWSVVNGKHEPLVSQEIFDAVQARLRDQAKGGRGPNLGAYLFSGLGVCLHCGRSLKGISRKGHRYYRCNAYDDAGVKVCQYGMVREDALLDVLLRTLEDVFLDPVRQEKLLARARAKLEKDQRPEAITPLRKRLADLEGKIAHGNGNLLLLPPERVRAVLDTLKTWEEERDRLRAELNGREHGAAVVDLEETFRGVQKWLWQLRDVKDRLHEPGMIPVVRDLIVAGLAKVAVRWERQPGKKRVRHIPTDGVLYLWDARGQSKSVPCDFHGKPCSSTISGP